MTLGSPWMLLLFPLLVLVVWIVARARRLQYAAACQLKGVTPEDHSHFLTRRDWFLMASLACIVVALARPQWNPQQIEIERRGHDVVFVLDVSRSMLAADIFPNRLELARIAIHEALPALIGQRLGLVTFAGSASVRVPLTLDHEFVCYMLDRADPMDMDMGSTSLQAAVEKVVDTVLTDATGGRRDLVIFTDGEDHLSDIDKTAKLLAQHRARVLIIGLGDPVQGARVPDALDDDKWMKHNGSEVVSRLQESTLRELAAQASNVTYFPARTRPFDLVTVYRDWMEGTGDDMVVGGVQQVRYTEGYPYFLAAAIILWLIPGKIRLPAMPPLLLLALLLPGCTGPTEDEADAAFRARFKQGTELLGYAEEISEADPFAGRSLFMDAREQFLRAALLREGDIDTARKITTITGRLRELETQIEQQRAEERRKGEKLAEMVQRLEKLATGQDRLAQRSRRIMRRRTIQSDADYNVPDPSLLQLPPQAELERLAPKFRTDQQALNEGTTSVLDGLEEKQQALRQILTRAYGNTSSLPPTEVDPIVELLANVVSEQEKVLANLVPGEVSWPPANTALHTAAGRMEQALEALRTLQPPKADEADDTTTARNVGDNDQNMEGVETVAQDDSAKPVSPGDFQDALSLQTLPIPNYSPADILAEEAANQQKRARRKATRSAAQVEKNW